MNTYEWWPDHGAGPLFLRTRSGGVSVEVSDLDIPTELAAEIRAWNASYNEDKLPIDGPGDRTWIASGALLLERTRSALRGRGTVVVTEPWWESGLTER
jgi:hypothetical protein